jgi:hypothetical protein
MTDPDAPMTILDWVSARMATAPVRPAPPRSHFEKRILAAADYLEGKPVKLIAADRKTTPATVYKAVDAFGLPYRKPKHSAAMRARAWRRG